MIVHNTPIESYSYRHNKYFVKREDMSCSAPGPPFAKVRGLGVVMGQLKDKGVTTVGYMDTAISMAGWGISYFAQELQMQAVLYYPQYKDGYKYNQAEFIPKWLEFGATIKPLEKPQMQAINILRARKMFKNEFPKGVWLPNGLKFMNTVAMVEEEALQTLKSIHISSIVISLGSGVMTAGVLRAVCYARDKISIYVVTAHNKLKLDNKRKQILDLAVLADYDSHNLLRTCIAKHTLTIVNGGYDYYETPENTEAPFPCNKNYDIKAFVWMCDNINKLEQPVLFWNIGA